MNKQKASAVAAERYYVQKLKELSDDTGPLSQVDYRICSQQVYDKTKMLVSEKRGMEIINELNTAKYGGEDEFQDYFDTDTDTKTPITHSLFI
jgi:hypothetical protein